MDFTYNSKEIIIDDKVITDLDMLVLEFKSIIEKYTQYVFISGYLPIFFGRTRGTEDVDVFIKRFDEKTFFQFYDELDKKGWYFLNPEKKEGLYEMLNEHLSIRAAKKDTLFPNIEMKYIKDEIDEYTINNRVNLLINKKFEMYIAPIEVEIPYKIYLSSEKDIEDALYLWELFKEFLDKDVLSRFFKVLKVKGDIYGINV
jgi:succinate dehydrogenase flavin-adding protein (antitoxin of CptAB toxin-antitoxin module)